MDCLFCKIINNELPSYTIFEDDLVKVILDINPDASGHTLIIPKQHIVDLKDIDQKTLWHLNQVANNIYDLYKEKLNIDGLTIIQNNGYGQIIKHYHVHLIPRFNNDNYHALKTKNNIINPEKIYHQIKD